METDQRRKRKRAPKPLYSPSRLFSVRYLILCLGFLAFIYLLSVGIPVTTSAFRPILVVSSLSLLSSSSTSNSIRDDYENTYSPMKLKIDDRVLFPDHVLLIVSNSNVLVKNSDEFECVYVKILSNSTDNSIDEIGGYKGNFLWVDEYDDFRSIFRCPLPPENYSSAVNLQRRRRERDVNLNGFDVMLQSNRTVQNWENLAYEAKLDGETAVVFVKGLNLRPNRKSDYRQFSCHFGLGNSDEKFAFRTKAISAAQEVVRCLLPQTIQINPNRAQGIRVTIGVSQNLHSKAHEHVLVPSVAKIFNSKSEKKKKKKNLGKYELCVCTMVWNQASSLREWIMYHSWLGIQKWFIYDNNSDDTIKNVIEELEQENYNVTRHVWPWIKTQEAGFSHCALRSREQCNWVGFMDVDEFFYFPRKYKKWGVPGQNSLRSLVSNFSLSSSSSSSRIGEIRTTCHSFGPSGLRSTPLRGVTVGYTCRIQSPERHKSIVRPDALDLTLLNVVHHFRLRKGFKYQNLPQSRGVINHYKYQVWEAFRAKFFRRVATYVTDWKENQNEGSRDRAPGLGTEAIEPPNWALQFCEVRDIGLRDTVLANLTDPTTGLLPWERRNYLM